MVYHHSRIRVFTSIRVRARFVNSTSHRTVRALGQFNRTQFRQTTSLTRVLSNRPNRTAQHIRRHPLRATTLRNFRSFFNNIRLRIILRFQLIRLNRVSCSGRSKGANNLRTISRHVSHRRLFSQTKSSNFFRVFTTSQRPQHIRRTGRHQATNSTLLSPFKIGRVAIFNTRAET